MDSDNTNTMTTFDIKIATLADAETLATLGAKTFSETFAKSNAAEDMNLHLKKTFTVDKVAQEIQDPTCTFIIAFEKTTPVGYAKLRQGNMPKTLHEKNALEIERIYVSKDFHGRKVGQALMQTCLNIAREKNYTAVWLGVWEHNATAIQFYERWGFEKFGSHDFLLGNDRQTDILMKLSLA